MIFKERKTDVSIATPSVVVTVRRSLCALIFLSVIAGGVVFLLRLPPDPVYQNKRLSDWLADFNPPRTNVNSPRQIANPDAVAAVRAIGSNAVPMLVSMLRAQDSPLKLKLVAWTQNQPIFKLHFVLASEKHWRAVRACDVLGSDARSASPAVVEVLNTDRQNAWYAAQSLVAMEPEFITLLTQALTNQDSKTRVAAAAALRRADAKPAIPALLVCLKDQDRYVRAMAAGALGFIRSEPERTLPALITALADPQANVCHAAAEALGRFGPRAKAAVPMLLKFRNEGTEETKIIASTSLSHIDPEAANGVSTSNTK